MERRCWEPDEIDLVLEYYPVVPTDELAQAMGRTLYSIRGLASKLQLNKEPWLVEAMSRVKMQDPSHPARKHWIQKGNVPPNKGVKRPGYAAGRMGETQFKKGQQNYNVMPIGATRRCDGYELTKVSAVRYVPYTVNWKPTHVLLWEKTHGPVPQGHAICFKDGNRKHIELSNLEMLSRAELARRNSIHNLPEDLKQVIRLKGHIKRRVNTLRRKHAKEQN